MKKIRLIFFVAWLLLATGILSGCGQAGGGIDVEDIWARPGLADGNSAAFFVIHNRGSSEDRLVSASSDIAAAVELHKSSMVDGTMKMAMQEFIPIPAGGKVEFKPGDFHVMLIGLHNDLAVGDEFEITLTFESGLSESLNVTVREP